MSLSVQNTSSLEVFQNNQTPQSKDLFLDEISPTRKADTVSLSKAVGGGSVECYEAPMKPTMIIRRVDLACIAYNKAGDHKAFYSKLSGALWEDGDLQIAYHEFSASLSEEDLDHFLTALEQNPGNLTPFLSIASQLSEAALSPFLEGAALAGDEVDDYLGAVSDLLAGEEGASPAFQYTFLAAGVSWGNNVMSFFGAMADLSDRTLEAVAEFVSTELSIPDGLNEDMDLFAFVFGSADEEDLLSLMELASKVSDIDKTHLLMAASATTGDDGLSRFVQQAKSYAGGSPAALSDYLEVASDAEGEGRLDTFMAMASSFDLSDVREFSAVDTANFLDAAQRNPDHIDELTQAGQALSGTDRSYMFYAAANTASDVDGLLENTDALSGRALSDYLLGKANEGRDTTDATIFMTAILDDDAYDDFQRITGFLNREEVDTLAKMTDEFSGQRRSEFLSAGAAAGESASEFLAMFDSLSSKTRADYLDVATQLDAGNRVNFVQASVNAGKKLDEFIQLTGELMKEESETIFNNRRDVLDAFLSLANKADPEDLEGLIGFIDELDSEQRAGFLRVGDRSGLNVGDLTRLGNKALSLGSRFSDIFGEANVVAGNTNLSVKDYEYLIAAAKSEDKDTWNDTRFFTFYRDYPGIDLLV